MGKQIITFYDNKIEKSKLHRCKNQSFLEDADIDNTLISGKISGKKNYK